MSRYEYIKQDFVKAVSGLEEALAYANTELEVDGTLQRFEFTFELFWKTLKLRLEQEGIIANSPKECLKEAFRLGWIKDEESALRMLDDRSLTVHVNDQKISREISERVKSHYKPMFRSVINQL